MDTSTQRARFARDLFGGAVLVGGLTLASCASSEGDNGAASSGSESGGQADSEPSADLSDSDAELEELQESLEEIQESDFSGSGSGAITIEGVDYSFEATTCAINPDFGVLFDASGPGETADGVPFWASLSTGLQVRSRMEAAGLDAASLDSIFGDRDSIESFGVSVELGKDDQFTSGDDFMADFSGGAIDIATSNDVSYTIDGNTLSGSASVQDRNGVAIEFNESAPATFSASCE